MPYNVQKFLAHRELPGDGYRHAIMGLTLACLSLAGAQFILCIMIVYRGKCDPGDFCVAQPEDQQSQQPQQEPQPPPPPPLQPPQQQPLTRKQTRQQKRQQDCEMGAVLLPPGVYVVASHEPGRLTTGGYAVPPPLGGYPCSAPLPPPEGCQQAAGNAPPPPAAGVVYGYPVCPPPPAK